MSTIHILGSEGFVGRAIQSEARAIDQDLYCWSHSQSDSRYNFNILDSSSWVELLKHKPATVVFLSWPGLPNYQASFHLSRNLPASLELVERLINAGMERLVVAGTCYEYGLQNGSLKASQMTDPINSYAIAKDTLRRAIANICDSASVTWSWLRIFYPYGVGQNPNSLLPSLQKAIDEGMSSFPMSSGRQIRDFVSVETLARQFLLLSLHPQAYGIYNGASGYGRSLREIVESRIHELGGKITLEFGAYPDRADEPLAFWADMSRMTALEQNQTFFHDIRSESAPP